VETWYWSEKKRSVHFHVYRHTPAREKKKGKKMNHIREKKKKKKKDHQKKFLVEHKTNIVRF